MRCLSVDLPNCGAVKVYVQGERTANKVGILTVHDIGQNYKSFLAFAESLVMHDILEKSVWIHFCLPGQEDAAENLRENFIFPSMDLIADDLNQLLNLHSIPSVLCLGEGAGADILYRFALKYPSKCSGLILINVSDCSGKTSSRSSNGIFAEKIRSKFQFLKHRRSISFNQHYDGGLNVHNVEQYALSFKNRSKFDDSIKRNNKIDVLLVAGSMSKNYESTQACVSMNLGRQHLVILETAHPLENKHEELAKAIILFCKGCAKFMDVPIMGLETDFNRFKHNSIPTAAQLQIAKRMQCYENMIDKDL